LGKKRKSKTIVGEKKGEGKSTRRPNGLGQETSIIWQEWGKVRGVAGGGVAGGKGKKREDRNK